MTAHFLRYANFALNLQPPMSGDDLIDALTSHYPIHVQKDMIGSSLKTMQDALNYFIFPTA